MGISLRRSLLIMSFVGFSTALSGCYQSFTTSSTTRTEFQRQLTPTTIGFNGGTTEPIFEHNRSLSRLIPLVKKISKRYEVDWIFILALMKEESRFDYEAISHRGAYGLMQLMPITQVEVAERLGVDEVESPTNNIRAGIYHLKLLKRSFEDCSVEDRFRLTLAAYNAGLSRVQDAQRIVEFLGSDPKSWNAVREALPLLSKRSYTLHEKIWAEGKPPSGYFGGARVTIAYVENALRNYDEYSLALK
ncbi:MAG: transglycosylase SLT domain-containing protein [Ignavibacteriales bacterium]|nr:transglycosylase SLT domain-containing protein [Ignavibacteriales bacterium]